VGAGCPLQWTPGTQDKLSPIAGNDIALYIGASVSVGMLLLAQALLSPHLCTHFFTNEHRCPFKQTGLSPLIFHPFSLIPPNFSPLCLGERRTAMSLSLDIRG